MEINFVEEESLTIGEGFEFDYGNVTDDTNDIIGLSLADRLEQEIPDDSFVTTVKYNFDLKDDNETPYYPLFDIRAYVKDLAGDILYSSCGIHYNGKHKQPHVHYHFITNTFYPPSNPSQHRKRWAKKNEASLDFLKCSFMFQPIDTTKPKYSTLSYPLKEGHEVKCDKKFVYIDNMQPMTKDVLLFLKEVGKAIYDKECALKLRQDKCEERKKVTLHTLFEICAANKDKFSSYRQMIIWLEDNYITKLSLDELPDVNHYRTNCQKIAVNLGILKYCDII